MPQSPTFALVARGPTNAPVALQVDAQGGLRVAELSASNSALNITEPTVVKASAGFVARVVVIVAGSAPGTVNDLASTSGAAVANEICSIPNTVGPIVLEFPFATGLLIVPGTGQTVAVSYR